MNPFKTVVLTWWQVGLLKLAVASLGIAVGDNFPDAFKPWTRALLVVTVVAGLYVAAVWVKQ
jgi:hypothetical protein